MAFCIESMGLDFLTETEEVTRGLIGGVIQEGQALVGYYGHPYFHKDFGDAEVIVRTIRKDAEKNLEVTGMDTHAGGNCVWDVCLSDINVSRREADALERRCAVRKSDGSGMAIVNIVHADVLPCFDEGEEIRLQMVAFPSNIQYFADEKAYEADQPESENGRTWLLADGAVFPIGFMQNHDANGDAPESNEDLDDLMLIRGTVKGLYRGMAKFGDAELQTFIHCIIGTDFGDLQIVHTIDNVPEEQRDNIRIGATVNGAFILSGDAAIYEYDQGMILDEEHDLRLLKGTFNGADPERVRYTFAENATYISEGNGDTCVGRDAIIERFKWVLENAGERCFAHMATIVSIDEGDEQLPYSVGTRCTVLAYGEETKYASIAFVDTDQDGRINKLTISRNGRYHFQIDEKKCPKNPWDDIEIPKSVVEPIVFRAQYHGIIDENLGPEAVLENGENYNTYTDNARRMLEAMPQESEADQLPNLFGYLFAKATEAAFTERRQDQERKGGLIVSYAPGDAWNGVIHTLLLPDQEKKIAKAMELGKQFAKDFGLFHPADEPHNDTYDKDIMQALIVVQQLGELYTPKLFA